MAFPDIGATFANVALPLVALSGGNGALAVVAPMMLSGDGMFDC
jgi:hypothetical protein